MIYHLCTKQQFKSTELNGFYSAESLITEGFIHASMQEQVLNTWKRYYNDNEMLVLHIDEAELGNKLKLELAPSVNEYFPHIYGEIPLSAIKEITPITQWI